MEFDEFYRRAIDMVAKDYIDRYHKEPAINVHNLDKMSGYGALIMCDDIAVYMVGFNKNTETWTMRRFGNLETKMWRDEA